LRLNLSMYESELDVSNHVIASMIHFQRRSCLNHSSIHTLNDSTEVND
jgi:hypothetical protein